MNHLTERGNWVSTMNGVDLDMLAEYLTTKMETEHFSLRGAAKEIGCSPATLSRLLSGNKSHTTPDTVNLMRAASWLERSLSEFDVNMRPEDVTMEDVEIHLRALKNVSEKTAAQMIATVRALYDVDKYESSGPSS